MIDYPNHLAALRRRMGSLFSSKNRPLQDKVTDEDRAILALKIQRDKMKASYKRHENDIAKQKEMARILLKEGRKERALILLKRKRYQESIQDQILAHLDQIERLVHELESAQLNQAVFERLKEGGEALKTINEKFSIDDAERIMEENQEAAEKQKEISALLAGKLTEEDLEAVEEEYNAIIREQLPEVPTDALPAVAVDEDETTPTAERKPATKAKRERVALEA